MVERVLAANAIVLKFFSFSKIVQFEKNISVVPDRVLLLCRQFVDSVADEFFYVVIG